MEHRANVIRSPLSVVRMGHMAVSMVLGRGCIALLSSTPKGSWFYVSHSMLIMPCFSSDLNSGSPVRRGQLLIIAKAAAKESAYEIG